MFSSKSFRSSAIAATVAAIALSSVAPTAVMAGTRTDKATHMSNGTSAATDISSARRVRRGGGGNAAALAAFGAIAGTVGAIAASQNRGYYDDAPGYGYYGGGPAYYSGPGYGGYDGYRGGVRYGGHGYDNSRNNTW